MADERRAYPNSSRRSEQLSCIKLFHLSYGLFSIKFSKFLKDPEILKLFNSIENE